MKKKKSIAALLAAAMVFGLAGCGGTGDNQQSSQSENGQSQSSAAAEQSSAAAEQSQSATQEEQAAEAQQTTQAQLSVTWWGSQTRADMTQEALALYESLNPGITFDGQFLSSADYWNKLATSAAGHTMADVIQMDKSYIQQYVDNNMLVDLQPYVDSGVIDLSDVDPVVQEFGRVGDGLYAICIGVNSPALLYNKTLLEENDITVKDNMTMDEFLELCREIYEKTGYKTNLQYNNGTSFMDFFMRSRGETLFLNGEIGASEETIADYFNLYVTGKEEGWLIDPSVFAEVSIGQPEQEPLVYGSEPARMSWCAFYFSNNMTAISNAAPEGMEIGITTWPADDAVKANYLKPAMFLSVSVDSQYPEEAARLIDFWTNSVECNEILMGERGVPVSSAVATAITPKMDEVSQKVVTFINEVVTPKCSDVSPASPNGATEVYDLIYKLEEAICYGEKTAEEAAAEVITKGNEIIANKQ